jgi:hypothetical protein
MVGGFPGDSGIQVRPPDSGFSSELGLTAGLVNLLARHTDDIIKQNHGRGSRVHQSDSPAQRSIRIVSLSGAQF